MILCASGAHWRGSPDRANGALKVAIVTRDSVIEVFGGDGKERGYRPVSLLSSEFSTEGKEK